MISIPIARPIITEDEIRAVEEVLKSGMLAQGRVVEQFEEAFAEYIGTRSAVSVCNGTIALCAALKSLGVKQGDEVITTPFTFIATANSILHQGARPIFADVDERTFNINPDDVLEKVTSKTKAILGVHLFGHPFDVQSIREICEDHNLHLIEDCAQAHGAKYSGKRVGCSGVGCFSFYPTKNMTTGEGGMITTSSDEIAEACRLLRNHGDSGKYFHTSLGFNYRMTNIQAAIGVEQLRKLDEFNEKRIKNAEYLNKHLKAEGLITPYKDEKVEHVYHQYVLKVEDNFPMSRDIFMNRLQEKGVGCAIHYPLPIFKQPLYQQLGYDDAGCPVASELANKVLSLPVHPALTEDDLRYIVEVIGDMA